MPTPPHVRRSLFSMKISSILAFTLLSSGPSAAAFTALQTRRIPTILPSAASLHPAQSRRGVTFTLSPPPSHSRKCKHQLCASSLPNNESETPTAAAAGVNKRYLHELFLMTRPINFPIVTLFHILGVHLSFQLWTSSTASSFTAATATITSLKALLLHPSLLSVLFSLLLITSTSMITNDYYDARNGVDAVSSINGNETNNEHYHPLATGRIPFTITKTFDSILYALLLYSSAFVPGIIPRVLVLSGAIVTYLYTVHLKPVTFVKNWSCAGLVALSPITSGLAAWRVLMDSSSSTSIVGYNSNSVLSLGTVASSPLSYLVLALFAGITSREILMDITDLENDGRAGIQTIPVRYGTKTAANVAFGWSFLSAVAACALPLVKGVPILVELMGERSCWELMRTAVSTPLASFKSLGLVVMAPTIRRLLLSVVGSVMLLHRAYSVVRTKGEDVDLAEKAVGSSLFSVLLVLASFV